MAEPMLLHRAPWVVPMTAPPIENGAVLAGAHAIEAVGRYSALRRMAPADSAIVDHPGQALLPGLVNAHAHLEWTGLAARIPLPQHGFPAWLQVFNRERATLSADDRETAVATGRRLLDRSGTACWADVGTTVLAPEPSDPGAPAGADQRAPAGPSIGKGDRELAWFEILGFNETQLHRAAPPACLGDPGPGPCPARSLAVHACYSTSAELIRQAKDWTRQRALPFAIHLAEHPEELELLRSGTGFFRDFLEALGRWVPSWSAPGLTPTAFLDRLGVLDPSTLLVHAVHLDAADWEIVARSGAAVCFCPRSNLALEVGLPDLEAALRRGIPTALGTDSLASNQDLDLFREAAMVLSAYPEVRPERVLQMITCGGAAVLGRTGRFGTLAPGGWPRFLAVNLPSDPGPRDLATILITQGAAGQWQWTPA